MLPVHPKIDDGAFWHMKSGVRSVLGELSLWHEWMNWHEWQVWYWSDNLCLQSISNWSTGMFITFDCVHIINGIFGSQFYWPYLGKTWAVKLDNLNQAIQNKIFKGSNSTVTRTCQWFLHICLMQKRNVEMLELGWKEHEFSNGSGLGLSCLD